MTETTTTVTARWDTAVADNHGWLLQYGDDGDEIPPGPAYYHLEQDDLDELREAVISTATWESIELADNFELVIE